MPYPFAHPLAVLPLAPLMGRLAVPSALVIGSIAPDLWYALPFGSRHVTHSAEGLLLFCLPVSLAAYLLFHLLLKEPGLALLPPTLSERLRGFTVKGLPSAPLHAVFGSLVLGSVTHLAWDGLTKSHTAGMQGINWLQHGSTLLGSVVLAWWLWRKLRSAPLAPYPQDAGLSPSARAWVWAVLLVIASASAGWSASEWPAIAFELDTLRRIAKTAAGAAMQGLVLAAVLCCAAWKLR